MNPLRLGLIDYLNAYPLRWPLESGLLDLPPLHMRLDRPGILNQELRESRLDLALVSAFEYAAHPELYRLSMCTGLSSRGYVDSVRLLSRVPLEDLDGAIIHVTSASATTVAALKILLAELGIKPAAYESYDCKTGFAPQAQAVLTIGDEAMRGHWPQFPHRHDIGQLWSHIFRRNIVFAVCAIRREAAADRPREVARILGALAQAPALALAHPDFETACRLHYPELAEPLRYLRRLSFTFGQAERDDLLFFYERCHRLGLIPAPVQPFYLECETGHA